MPRQPFYPTHLTRHAGGRMPLHPPLRTRRRKIPAQRVCLRFFMKTPHSCSHSAVSHTLIHPCDIPHKLHRRAQHVCSTCQAKCTGDWDTHGLSEPESHLGKSVLNARTGHTIPLPLQKHCTENELPVLFSFINSHAFETSRRTDGVTTPSSPPPVQPNHGRTGAEYPPATPSRAERRQPALCESPPPPLRLPVINALVTPRLWLSDRWVWHR